SFNISAIRRITSYLYQLNRLNKVEEKYKEFITTKSTKTTESIQNYLQETVDNLDSESKNDESDNDDIEDEESMCKIINKWIKMLNNEETEDCKLNDIEEIKNNHSLDDLLAQIHLCQDLNVKWLLERLFDSGLESSF
ncbi:12895_t:CDS:1, partial [Racocetra fulgida]